MMIETFNSENEAITKIHDWLVSNLVPNTLLFVGGGSLAKLFAPAWQQLTNDQQAMAAISLTDERFGVPGHQNSNWQLLNNLGVDLNSERHLPVLSDSLDLRQTAEVWADKLTPLIKGSDKIMAIFGIGEDNHIAGIKPKSPAAYESVKLTNAYAWNDFERITISPVVFKMVDTAIICTSGPAKKPAVNLLNQNLSAVDYPSQLIKQTGNFSVYYLI